MEAGEEPTYSIIQFGYASGSCISESELELFVVVRLAKQKNYKIRNVC